MEFTIKKVCFECRYFNEKGKHRYKCYCIHCPARNGVYLDGKKPKRICPQCGQEIIR
jgi:hypothetical protein